MTNQMLIPQQQVLSHALKFQQLREVLCESKATPEMFNNINRIIFNYIKTHTEGYSSLMQGCALELINSGINDAHLLLAKLETSGGDTFDVAEYKVIVDDFIKASLNFNTKGTIESLYNKLSKDEIKSDEFLADVKNIKTTDISEPYNDINTLSSNLLQFADRDISGGVKSGYRFIQNCYGDFMPGDLITIAARTNVGKSSFALNLAYNMLVQNYGVAFFSLEMTNIEVGNRFVSRQTGIDSMLLKKPAEFNKNNLSEKYYNALNQLKTHKFFINDEASITPDRILQVLQKIKNDGHKVDVCFIDYIGLMDIKGKHETRTLMLGKITAAIKSIAKEMQIPVVIIAQLNRAIEGRTIKAPMLSDIRESGSIENDSNLIIALWQQTESSAPLRSINASIIKNRTGAKDTISLQYAPKKMLFEEA